MERVNYDIFAPNLLVNVAYIPFSSIMLIKIVMLRKWWTGHWENDVLMWFNWNPLMKLTKRVYMSHWVICWDIFLRIKRLGYIYNLLNTLGEKNSLLSKKRDESFLTFKKSCLLVLKWVCVADCDL